MRGIRGGGYDASVSHWTLADGALSILSAVGRGAVGRSGPGRAGTQRAPGARYLFERTLTPVSRAWWGVLLIGTLVPGSSLGQAFSDPLRVAVASSSRGALRELAEVFEREHGSEVVLSSGSTGKLFSQCLHGAPFDLFFAADLERPRRLVEEGLAEGWVRYADGALVLWVPGRESWRGRPWQEVVADPEVRRVALANPRVAPYGREALRQLETLGSPLAERRVVFGEDVGQTLQLVSSGAADAGFVALSQLVAGPLAGATEVWTLAVAGDALGHGAVRLRRSRHPAAQSFLDFVQSPTGQRILSSHGFRDPPSEPMP